MKKKIKRMKGYSKISIDTLDTKWGKLVRERDGKCRYCGGTNYLAAHHIFGRSRSGTRFVIENGITLCPSHHVFSDDFSAHKTPEKFKKWIKKEIGVKEYNRLQKLSIATVSREKVRKQFEVIVKK